MTTLNGIYLGSFCFLTQKVCRKTGYLYLKRLYATYFPHKLPAVATSEAEIHFCSRLLTLSLCTWSPKHGHSK